MTPYEQAAYVYQTEPCKRTFLQDLQLHLMYGYCYSDSTVFVMGRPVKTDAAYRDITNPEVRFEDPDAWWVYLYAGQLSRGLSFLPYQLPYIGWERQNKPRWYRLSDLLRHQCLLTHHFPLAKPAVLKAAG